jgi:hypothetical protein
LRSALIINCLLLGVFFSSPLNGQLMKTDAFRRGESSSQEKKPSALENEAGGLPNVSTRTKHSSNGFVVSADFLAWFPSQEPFSIVADVITAGLNTSSFTVPGFDFKWDYGFRIGAGANLAYDQWDTIVSWTSYSTEAVRPLPPMADIVLINPEFFAASLSEDKPHSMKVKWSLAYNMIDWELARSYWVSRDLSMRPFVGLKGGLIDQSIHAHYNHLTIANVPTDASAKERLKNNFWGIGPSGGVNTKWRVRNFGFHFFDLFGDFSLAAMWGSWRCSDIYENSLLQKTSVRTKNAYLGALMFRGFLGIGWDADLRGGSSHFATKLGYEMQFWLNQMRFNTFQLQRLHFDLTLQGVTFNCRYDF